MGSRCRWASGGCFLPKADNIIFLHLVRGSEVPNGIGPLLILWGQSTKIWTGGASQMVQKYVQMRTAHHVEYVPLYGWLSYSLNDNIRRQKEKKNRHYRVAATRHFIFKRHEWRWRRDGVVTGLVLSAQRNETIKKLLSDGMGRYTLLVFTTGWNNIFMFSRRGRDDTQISCKTFSMAFSGAVPDNFGK